MKNGDKKAHPSLNSSQDVGGMRFTSTDGLTKREYFAGLAMQGLLANPYARTESLEDDKTVIAKESVKMADELLKQLDKL